MKSNVFSTTVMILIFSGLLCAGQSKPEVSVRFYNPQYICETETYCLDVQFQSNTLNQQLFGMNLRFYYDDNILEYLGAGDFKPGYGLTGAPQLTTGPGSVFGFAGPADWVNGSVQLLNESAPDQILPLTDWLTLFKICFHVDDPSYFNVQTFCPSIVWDLQENWQEEEGGGFQPADDGVVMTLVDPNPFQDSAPSTEIVFQFNWQYGGNPNGVGHPVEDICIDTICGYIIPVSNWALFLGIGLMILATLFIYRRRMS
jgi:hypothetical protein